MISRPFWYILKRRGKKGRTRREKGRKEGKREMGKYRMELK